VSFPFVNKLEFVFSINSSSPNFILIPISFSKSFLYLFKTFLTFSPSAIVMCFLLSKIQTILSLKIEIFDIVASSHFSPLKFNLE